MMTMMKVLVMMTFLTIILTRFPTSGTRGLYRLASPWIWNCQNQTCVKMDVQETPHGSSLTSCKLTCGPYGSLWPRPTVHTYLSSSTVPFLPGNIKLRKSLNSHSHISGMIQVAVQVFQRTILEMYPAGGPMDNSANKQNIDISIVVTSNVTRLKLDTDESYVLIVQTVGKSSEIFITANTFFGARHALETLTQIIAYDEYYGSLQLVSQANIVDFPVFPHRGILLDTSRNFYSLKSIKKLIDAMSYNKLNTFHWHITDSHSFPMHVPRVPDMTRYGAYSPSKIYFPEDIIDLVNYANQRGVRVLPEFDAPAHAGNGWQWGEKSGKGKMSLCVNYEPWTEKCVEPPCGQLNPVNDDMYSILGDIYRYMIDIFQPDMFHMGGDEVNKKCWETSPEISEWLDERQLTWHENTSLALWDRFQTRALELLLNATENRELPIVMWTSDLTSQPNVQQYLDPQLYVIQIWTQGNDTQIGDLVKKGYKVIFSNYDAWYLDCGFSAWVGDGNNWCTPYKGWQLAYDNNPLQLLRDQGVNITIYQPLSEGSIRTLKDSLKFTSQALMRELPQVLGGEAAMWSEQVDEFSVEMKIWPRSAAMAERLWSNPETTWREAESRMIHHRSRMVRRGVGADALQPEWCHQNPGHCELAKKEPAEESTTQVPTTIPAI